MKVKKAYSALLITMLMGNANADTNKAMEYWEKGDVRAAVIELKTQIQSDPNDLVAREALAKIYISEGKWLDAEKELTRIKESRNLNATEALLLANIFLKINKVDDIPGILNYSDISPNDQQWTQIRVKQAFAKSNFSIAKSLIEQLQKNNNSVQTQLLSAELDLYEGLTEQAAQSLSEILQQHPSNIDAITLLAKTKSLLNKPHEAIPLYESLAKERGFLSIDELGRAIESYLKTQDLVKAKKAINTLAELAPRNPITDFYKGSLALLENDINAAKNHFDQALAKSNNFYPAMYYSALVNYQLKEYNQAEKLLSRLTETSPANIQYQLLMSKLLIATNREDIAISRLERLATVKESMTAAIKLLIPLYLKNKQYDEAVSLVSSNAVQQSESGSELSATLALGLLQQGKKDDANQLISTLDNSQESLIVKAIALSSEEKNQAALDIFEQLEKEQNGPLSTQVQLIKARTLHNAKQYKAAKAAFSQVLNTEPENILALHGKAMSSLALEEYSDAVSMYKKIYQLQPTRSDAPVNIVKISLHAGDTATAKQFIHDNWQQVSTSAGLSFARFTAQQKDWPFALEQFSFLASKAPESEEIMLGYAGSLAATDKLAEAIKKLSLWIENHQSSFKSDSYLATLLEQAGKRQQAMEVHYNLVKQHPDNPMVLNNAAWFLKDTDPKAAITYAEKAYDLAPNIKAIRDTLESLKAK